MRAVIVKLALAVKPLFFETNGKVGVWHLSLGRVSFWLVFLLSLYMWEVQEKELPTKMFELLLFLLGYNFSKKLTNPLGEFLKGKAKPAEPSVDAQKNAPKATGPVGEDLKGAP